MGKNEEKMEGETVLTGVEEGRRREEEEEGDSARVPLSFYRQRGEKF